MKENFTDKFLSKSMPLSSQKKKENSITTLKQKPILLLSESSVLIKRKKNNKKPKKLKSISGKKVLASLKNGNVYSYKDYEPLREIWKQYMNDLLPVPKDADQKEKSKNATLVTLQETMLKVDLHGAEIKVVESATASLIGIEGTVIVETKNIFSIITNNNKMINIPKAKNIFHIHFDDYLFTIFGDQFCIKPSLRMVKKFKNYVPYLNI